MVSSPHGENFKMNCDDCHNTIGWEVNPDSINFSHDTTGMPLTGRHTEASCRGCHQTLVFSEAETFCASCHTDMHENTVGKDCDKCHNTESWIVNNIIDLHRQTRFPLLGAHAMADCQDCHVSASLLRFEPMGVECFDCHQQDYAATTNPNHPQAGFSTECTDCHLMNGFTWSGAGINHSFFPLEEGHDIADCMSCHTEGNFNNTSPACISCHQPDYAAAINPNHTAANFPTECGQCHTLSPGWSPASFSQHDGQFFPIYSGEHNGEWNTCADCHKNASNFAEFTCTDCHEHNQGDMDDEHDDIVGYQYTSSACLACHPNGSAEGAFSHSSTAFPLTGAHTEAVCQDCHTDGYTGTATFCYDCHTTEFNQSANPPHVAAGIPNTCADCHTTQPGWSPATFPNHNQFYALNGAHAIIASECATCHNGNYTSTPNTCAGCHLPDYNQTTNPSHTAAQFPTDCAECHSETAWQPATFNHDGLYFPIYSGEHNGGWDACSDCHANPANYSQFTCISCHEHNQADMNDKHNDVQGYIYNSPSCLSCHPDGSANGAFNHGSTAFPLTGSHAGAACIDCHTAGYSGTTTVCFDCHQPDFNQSQNPNHSAANLPNTCADCHTTQPGWSPASFPIHNQFYALNGAHATIASECATCHNGNYTSTPNTCAGCHLPDYNQTTNPPHASSQFPTECQECHAETGWVPSTFNHEATYPLTGAHAQAACIECHASGYSGTTTVCFDCHQPDYNQSQNPNHSAINIPNTCADCHTTIPGWSPAAFPIHNQYYQLNGAHAAISNDCENCHNGNYNTTPNTCTGCHIADYNQTTNPPHASAQFPTECQECHTETSWVPSTFDHDNQYFPIYSGRHQGEWNACSDCHTNPTNYAQFSCINCHEHNQTDMNIQHANVTGYVYNSNACLDCHPDGESKKKHQDQKINYRMN